MQHLLISWIGRTDIQAANGEPQAGRGPIGQAVEQRSYDEVLLISNYPKSESVAYQKWLKGRAGKPINLVFESLKNPTDFGQIYDAAVRRVGSLLERHTQGVDLTFHLSPGTPAMQAVWIILAKTRFPAELIQSSKEEGVKTAAIPFEISAEYIPDLLKRPDNELERLSAGLSPEAVEFKYLIHRSSQMKKAIALARRIAVRRVSVLLEGESGTGKELFARAIHQASPRRSKPFITVNCGAIPEQLIESELFGYVKGAFTGAGKTRAGHFEAADGGTLFLDEIGELPRGAQVKLLRVLQENEVIRLGSSTPKKIDVRVVAATNRNLLDEIHKGNFRDDLFYRIAAFIIPLPPLRERQGDVGLLVDHYLDQLNRESALELGVPHKTISPGARNLLLKHIWPGNIRELQNTLLRAVVCSSGNQITTDDMQGALIHAPSEYAENILNLSLGNGFDLREVISTVARHYLARAMQEAKGSKTTAARLVGLPSYQTLSNWLKTYNVR
jgi:transcriptional regulator with PAS, ATPase and Fis domain